MSFKQLHSYIKNEEGSGLILALMTLLVLSVLGASLGAVTIGSFKLGDNTRDDSSAYYIAEAGANMAYEEMKAGVMAVYDKNLPENSFFNGEDGVKGVRESIDGEGYTFEEQSGEVPTATITVKEVSNANPREYVITSVGEVDGKTRTVKKPLTVSWSEGDIPIEFPNESAIISKGDIELKNGVEIHGNIYLPSDKSITKKGNPTIYGETFHDSKYDGLYDKLNGYILEDFKNPGDDTVVIDEGDYTVPKKSTHNGTIIVLKGDVVVPNHTVVNGSIFAPLGNIYIGTKSDIYGMVLGININIDTHSIIKNENNFDFPPGLEEDTNEKNDDLISTKPAIEPN
ncbi:PilX N-terminal domain-containing pilus assembly protein [Alkalibacterium kapii]|uniref:Type 4 fimbrial biogenesis protein PilX N-terminal domain-containing protein n=1 Tax=Alkalibacterium kapii TaxID=426704 RepID=A0A511AS79_9LACT|nr:pilus assembly PilX N-terminal domain-containing protein [Alkalibacterium kapii]GEK90602.1 hypothetical protein AKA01nite_02240 [Alkalibacterium kapii]